MLLETAVVDCLKDFSALSLIVCEVDVLEGLDVVKLLEGNFDVMLAKSEKVLELGLVHEIHRRLPGVNDHVVRGER